MRRCISFIVGCVICRAFVLVSPVANIYLSLSLYLYLSLSLSVVLLFHLQLCDLHDFLYDSRAVVKVSQMRAYGCVLF